MGAAEEIHEELVDDSDQAVNDEDEICHRHREALVHLLLVQVIPHIHASHEKHEAVEEGKDSALEFHADCGTSRDTYQVVLVV